MSKPKSNSGLERLVGYARVSTTDQNVAMQVEALIKAGVPEEFIYHESASGSKKSRPQLKRALAALREGDTLVVWKLDRVARSMTHLLELMEGLEAEGIKFRSLTEGIETQTPAGRLIMHVLAALSQFERELIRERSRAGVAAAKERGVQFGQKPKLSDEDVAEIWRLVHEKGVTRVDAAKQYGVTTMTIARRLKGFEEAAARKLKKSARRRAKKS